LDVRRHLVLVPLAAVLLVAACGGAATRATSDAGTQGRVSIVTTTTQLTDFAKVVAGGRASVYGVLKANVDPHDYEPSPADLRQLAEADVIVKNGLRLEAWFDDTIKAAGPRGEIVDASGGIELRGGGDPHIWHSPANARRMVASIAQALVKVDPEHRAEYLRNEADYARQLDDLDVEVRANVARLSNNKVVTNHDAFGYYLDRYGLELVGSVIPSFDTQAELSANAIRDIVAKIRSSGVKAVFSESSLPPKAAVAIGKEAGVKVVEGEDSLYGDTLGPAGSDGDTYLKMIRHNTREIVDNLS